MFRADTKRNTTHKAHPHTPVSHATVARLLSFRMQCFPPGLYKACSGHIKAYKCFAENLQTDHRKRAFSV
ncbi:hypothetical protein PROFUN_17144, partial [Planoprotostelium fungivorum]